MAYVTQADLQKRFPALKLWTDDDASGSVDSDVVTEAIALGDAWINRAASQHYEVPLTLPNTETAAIIKQIAGTLAGHHAAERVNDTLALESMSRTYDDTIAFLERLKDGKEALEDETLRSRGAPSGKLVYKGDAQTMTPDNMKGW